MQHQSIHVIRPEQFDSATAQTPGSQRFAAVHPGAGIESPMWGGLFSVEPGARTGIHVVVNLHNDFWDDINLSPTHLRVDD